MKTKEKTKKRIEKVQLWLFLIIVECQIMKKHIKYF